MKRMLRPAAFCLGLFLLACPVSQGLFISQSQSVPLSGAHSTAGVVAALIRPNAQEAQMYTYICRERRSAGVATLILDADLCRIARMKSLDMVQGGYFAHTSPTYGSAGDLLASQGFAFSGWGENIARYGSLIKAHSGLMSSPGHRANILADRYTRVGIGIVADGAAYYITQIFVR